MRPRCAARRPLAWESLYENMRAKRLICASAARLGEAAGHSATAACPRYLYITRVRSLGCRELGLLVPYWTLAYYTGLTTKNEHTRAPRIVAR